MIKNDNSDSFCFRCYHTWKKRIKLKPSKYCPHCKSPYWNRPRKKISKDMVLKTDVLKRNNNKNMIETNRAPNMHGRSIDNPSLSASTNLGRCLPITLQIMAEREIKITMLRIKWPGDKLGQPSAKISVPQ